eukprot:TRINITY_DN3905_c0_g1_i7.p1 TRINITY_DN3905_c0_g1~~TRINITY_DN3905_c0_g1_i7.p1  ORF type:complete len:417 (+),score=98.52 TRINITY_DN3905_c0_g1_i7:67-1317(+)
MFSTMFHVVFILSTLTHGVVCSDEGSEGFLDDFFDQFPGAPFGYPKSSHFDSLNYSPRGEMDYEAEDAIARPSGKDLGRHSSEYHQRHGTPYEDYHDENSYIKSLPRRNPHHPSSYNEAYLRKQKYHLPHPVYGSTTSAPYKRRPEPSFAHIPGPPYEYYNLDEPYRLPHSQFWPNAINDEEEDEEPSFLKSFEKVRTRVNSYDFKKETRKRKKKKHRRRRPGKKAHKTTATSTTTTTSLPTTTPPLVVSTLPPRSTHRPALQFVDRTPSSIVVNVRAHPIHMARPPPPPLFPPRPIQFEEPPKPALNSTRIDESSRAKEEEDESVTLKHVEQLLIAILDHQQKKSKMEEESSKPDPILRRRVHPLLQNIKTNRVIRGAFGVLNTKAKSLGKVLFPASRRPRAHQSKPPRGPKGNI